MQAKHKQPSN